MKWAYSQQVFGLLKRPEHITLGAKLSSNTGIRLLRIRMSTCYIKYKCLQQEAKVVICLLLFSSVTVLAR